MEYSNVVRRRRMVRAFDPRPIPHASVDRLLGYTLRGPSSGFTQGFEFLVFDGPEQTAVFWNSCDPRMLEFMALTTPAPLIIVPFAHEEAYVDRYLQPDKAATARQSGADFPAPYWYIDAAFAAMLVLLGAIDERLGAFYFSVAPNRKGVETFVERVGVPSGYWPMERLRLGIRVRMRRPRLLAPRNHTDAMKRGFTWGNGDGHRIRAQRRGHLVGKLT